MCHNVFYKNNTAKRIENFKKVLIKKRLNGTPAGTRTRDQLIKSQLLYQLSYRGTWYVTRDVLQGLFCLFCSLVSSRKLMKKRFPAVFIFPDQKCFYLLIRQNFF